MHLADRAALLCKELGFVKVRVSFEASFESGVLVHDPAELAFPLS